MTSLTHQKAVNSSYLLAAITLITMPDMVTGLIMEILHLFLEFLHIAFEFIEVMLDHLVEHLFHTGVHQTQVIVFYTLAATGAIGVYFLWRVLRRLCYKIKENSLSTYQEKKTATTLYWHNQSAISKVKLVAIGSVGLTCIVLFGF